MVQVYGNLTKDEANSLLNNILCPSFNILPSKTLELDYKRERFNALIKEQCNLLDYLEEQRSAVINGAAGTGKTMIAIEKARRHSSNGESVLFLCFNSKLKDFLEVNYRYPNVEYYTIDGFACKLCNSQTADFEALELQIIELVENNQFPYTHIIIDEGQDLGQERIQSTKILELLEEIVLSKPTGTFYVFYDKLQLVQSYQLPKLIQEADCKLTLYKNCRNTKKIAETSFKPLKTVPKLFESALNGNLPVISFIDEINKLKEETYEIKPEITKDDDGNESKIFGIEMKSDIQKGFVPSVKYAFQKFVSTLEQMALTLGNLFTGGLSINNLSGPVGIYTVVGETRQAGLSNVLFLIAYLSINLGIMNILPIPALDGGHVLFLLIELITRKKVNQKVESITTTIFFVLLLLLMLYITIHDIITLIL